MLDHPQTLVDLFLQQLKVDIRNIPIEISSQGLMPWELACCWIDESGEATIRVRAPGETKKVYREAVLAHELVHAIRGGLFSSRFEEFTAYAICQELFPSHISWWRTTFGPLFTSVKEIYSILGIIWANALIPFFIDIPVLVSLAVPFIACFYSVARLAWRWRLWNKAYAKIQDACPDEVLAIIVRLSDDELVRLACNSDLKMPDSFF